MIKVPNSFMHVQCHQYQFYGAACWELGLQLSQMSLRSPALQPLHQCPFEQPFRLLGPLQSLLAWDRQP
jgi:hypothetical protein